MLRDAEGFPLYEVKLTAWEIGMLSGLLIQRHNDPILTKLFANLLTQFQEQANVAEPDQKA